MKLKILGLLLLIFNISFSFELEDRVAKFLKCKNGIVKIKTLDMDDKKDLIDESATFLIIEGNFAESLLKRNVYLEFLDKDGFSFYSLKIGSLSSGGKNKIKFNDLYFIPLYALMGGSQLEITTRYVKDSVTDVEI